MTNINMANRQCCDLDTRDHKAKASWSCADFCNTTTMGFSSEPVYANKKGQKCIKFDNPLDGTAAMTFQVHPFKVYAMLGNGEIETSAVITRKETTTCTTAGPLTLVSAPVTSTVFVYAEDDFGGKVIEEAVVGKIFTATADSELAVGIPYAAGYLEKKGSGVKKVSFNNKKVPEDFYIQMSALGKNKNGELVPIRITVYEVNPQRSLDLSFPSDGGPAEIVITHSALADDNDNVLGMIRINNEAE